MSETEASWDHEFGRNTTPVKYTCSQCLEEKPVNELSLTDNGQAYICQNCQGEQ